MVPAMHRIGEDCNQKIRLSIYTTVLAFFAINVGCCFYIPTPDIDVRSARGVVPDEVIESLKPGTTTRVDVLLFLGDADLVYLGDPAGVYLEHPDTVYLETPSMADLGDPSSDYHQYKDRFMVYYWAAEEGMFTSYVPGIESKYVTKHHYLCIEFDDANRIKRYKHFESGTISGIFEEDEGRFETIGEVKEWIYDSEN